VNETAPEAESPPSTPSKTSRIVWGIILALIGSVLTVIAAICSYAVFLLILFMFGLGGGTPDYIRNLTNTAGAVALGIFVIAVVSILSIVIQLHRRWQN
jgi:hypothetical protein